MLKDYLKEFTFSLISVGEFVHNSAKESICEVQALLDDCVLPVVRESKLKAKSNVNLPNWSSNNIIFFGVAVSQSALILTATALILADLVVLGTAASIIILALGGTATVILSIPIFTKTYMNLKAMKWNLNMLISLTIVLSLFSGEVILALFVAWVIRLGMAIQELNREKMRKAISQMIDYREKKVWLIVPGSALEKDCEVEVLAEKIKVGDKVAVRSGGSIWVDGIILEGEAAVDQMLFTGESVPAYKKKGDTVYAGTVVIEGSLKLQVISVAMETELGHIIKSIEEARDRRAPLTSISEYFSKIFVPMALLVSVGTLVITGSITTAIAVLIMSTPCAVLLSAPAAIFCGIRKAAQNGVLIKGGIYLEGLGQTNTVIFDKTGTLTAGNPQITTLLSVDKRYQAKDLLSMASKVEFHSSHPFAKAILKEASLQKVNILGAENFKVRPGKGIISFDESSKKRIAVGGRSLLNELNITLSKKLLNIEHKIKTAGESIVYIAENDVVVGVIGLIDSPEHQALKTINKLKEIGLKDIIMLTGDNKPAAQAVAFELGIEKFYCDLSPQKKLELTKLYKEKKGSKIVLFVGEGLNDAPAMAFSDIGMAPGPQAVDQILNEAGVVITDNDLFKIPQTINLGKKTRRIIKQNYTVGVSLNIAGMILAAGGMINPLLGVLIHEMATATVLLNSCRITGTYSKNRLFKIRKYRKEDHAQMVKMIVNVLAEEGMALNLEGVDNDLHDIQKDYFNNRGVFLVAVIRKEIVASVSVKYVSHDVCELRKLYLKKEYRGQGHGRNLLIKAKDFAISNGYKKMELEVSRKHKQAISLYEKMGFERSSRPSSCPRCEYIYSKLL